MRSLGLIRVTLVCALVNAFVLPHGPQPFDCALRYTFSQSIATDGCSRSQATRTGTLVLEAKKSAKKSKGGFAQDVVEEQEKEEEAPVKIYSRDKLAAEVATPWRKVRIFIYGAFGFSAFIGGLTAVTQLAASLGNQPDALPLAQCATNVAIDLGVVVTCAFGYNFENSQQQGLAEKRAADREKAEKIKSAKVSPEENAARVARLKLLSVKLASEEEKLQSVPVGALMQSAKQDLVVVAGGQEMLRDSMLRAMISKDEFVLNDLLVVPVLLAKESAGVQASTSDKGFGAKPAYFQNGFVGEPAEPDKWREIMEEEVRAAEQQGVTNAAKDGVVIVIKRDGTVLRRGVGAPKWDMIIQDLNPKLAKKG